MEEVSLRKFQRVWEKNDLTELGTGTDEELTDAWYKIYDEFIAITGDNSNAMRLSTVKRIAVNKSRIGYISEALRFVTLYPDPEIIELLKTEGVKYDPKNKQQSIDEAKRKLYKMKQSIDLAENDIKANTQDKAPDLEELIVELEQYQGYMFDRDKMSARTFATIYKKYKNGRRKNQT